MRQEATVIQKIAGGYRVTFKRARGKSGKRRWMASQNEQDGVQIEGFLPRRLWRWPTSRTEVWICAGEEVFRSRNGKYRRLILIPQRVVAILEPAEKPHRYRRQQPHPRAQAQPQQ